MQTILTVNGGSSSLKCALFQLQAGELQLLVNFKLGNILGDARFKVADASGTPLLESNPDYASIPKEERHQACLETIQQWLTQQLPDNELVAIGHRVVHGGSTFSEPVLVSDH